MGGFLYFVPDRDAGLGPQELRAAGLSYALDAEVHQQHIASGGLDGRGGVVLADAGHCEPASVRYAASEQEWVEVPTGWLGRYSGQAIGPDDLMRTKPLDGHLVELADGRKWLCPLAKLHVIEGDQVRWHHAFPRGVRRGRDKKWQSGEVVPRYRRLWQLALAWWDVRLASAPENAEIGQTIQFDFDGLHDAAVECLAANYRLGPDEVCLLGLFDSDSARKILDALIDLPNLVALNAELQKKTESPLRVS
jgi:hypothetical protein